MKRLGPLTDYRPLPLLRFAGAAMMDRDVLLGLAGGAGNFLLWLVVLSWADVSWALPMNALEYALTALLASLWLKERVAPRRWLGIALISAGVVCVMGSWR
ncbi:MAG: EamA family transporter [Elusimicrobia bacterium]|nr:EamA family transporter [Elusimicrobiota bacterium]